MHWNHRVMNCPSENGGDDYITFKEVYYEDGVPTSYSDPFIGCDTKEELQELVARLSRALEQQMLHEDMFKQGEIVTEKFSESQLKNWRKFEEIRKDGLFNMLDPRARELTGISRSEWVFCMDHYAELKQAATKGETA